MIIDVMSSTVEKKVSENGNATEEPAQKKLKISTAEHDSAKSTTNLSNFKGFEVEEILNEDADHKRIVVKGRFAGKDAVAIVILEKKPFSADSMKDVLTEQTGLETVFVNDIYGNYSGFVPEKHNPIKVNTIYPATQKHLDKYSKQSYHIVDETIERYRNISLPFLETSSFDMQWVFNILSHEKEADRIVYEDPDPETGFILLPDFKWDGSTMESLYLLAIVHKRGLKSVRDLTDQHLPLLKNIMEKGKEAIESKYGVKGDELKIYFHYQPTYYHLHVHFSHVKLNFGGLTAPNALMLANVINSIELLPDFFQKVTLPFQVRENDKLYREYSKAGVLPSKS